MSRNFFKGEKTRGGEKKARPLRISRRKKKKKGVRVPGLMSGRTDDQKRRLQPLQKRKRGKIMESSAWQRREK